IDRMDKRAEDNAEEDKKRREEVETRNAADQLIFSTDKTIEDLGDKVEAEEKEKAEAAKEELKTALEGEDLEEINAKKDALEEILQAMSMKLYEEMAKEQQAGENARSEERRVGK